MMIIRVSNLILKLDLFYTLSLPGQTQGESANQVHIHVYFLLLFMSIYICWWITEKLDLFHHVSPIVIGVLYCAGGGAYVVIDKRSKGEADAHGTSSDDGNIVLNINSRQIRYLIFWNICYLACYCFLEWASCNPPIASICFFFLNLLWGGDVRKGWVGDKEVRM